MIPKKILSYLDKNKVKYDIVKHKTVYTAYDLAQTLAKKMNEIAKTLVVKVDKGYVLVVVPGHLRVDLGKVKKILKAKSAELAPEKVMAKVFKVKPGAITPFGSLHKVEVLLDKALLKTKEAIVNAGSFTDSLRLKVKDLQKLEGTTLADVGQAVKKEAKKALKKTCGRVCRK